MDLEDGATDILASPDQAFDPDALRRKYREERDKRLRADGSAQYVKAAEAFAHYLRDPHAEAETVREPRREDIDVLVIGGGFGGLLTAVSLRKRGMDSVRIVEKGSDFGGVWYWNRYPGAACDIESYIYFPLIEEAGELPSEKYARGPEILRHAQTIGRAYDLYREAVFGTEVQALRWDEEARRWLISTDKGDEFRARFVCMSTGPLQKPRLPAIRGIDRFRGHAFHTSRWDYAYTGGGPDGQMTGLAERTVAVIGTGATGVQCIPHLGAAAKRLFVFQRTPAVVDVRANRPTDPEWARTLQPGWQRARMDNFNQVISGRSVDEDLVADGWTEILGGIGTELASRSEMAVERQLADFAKMEQIRARIDKVVTDPATAEALKPYYNIMCKRPCFHDTYHATFNRPNVTLVDTQGRGVEELTAEGVVAGGVEYKVDCVVFATGFEFQTAYSSRNGYEIFGRGGKSLTEKWTNGVSTLHGYCSNGFPNLFMIGSAQSANTPNFTHMLREGAEHVTWIIRDCLNGGVAALEPEAAAEQAWVEHCLSFAPLKRKYDQECTPSYYNNEGQPSDLSVRNGSYMGGSLAFMEVLKTWRDSGRFEGFALTRD